MARKHKPFDPAQAAHHEPQKIPRGKAVARNQLAPGLRVRHDGWTQERMQRFLDALAHTGCVRDAARVAGVSNQAGYRLKRLYPRFAEAWDAALARAQQGLIAIAYRRAVEGRETVIIRQGQEVERRIQPSDSILGLLIKRGDMAGNGLGGAAGPGGSLAGIDREDIITRDEWEQGWAFDWKGGKVKDMSEAEAEAEFDRRMERLREA
jgi:hypothetical protein